MNSKALAKGAVKVSLVLLLLVVAGVFVLKVWPIVAQGESETKQIYFVVKDSSGQAVANARVEMFVSDSLNGNYSLVASESTGSDGTATISTSASGYAYFVVSKLGYKVGWPDETGIYSESADAYVISVSDIPSSINVTLDVIPAIWTDKSEYAPEETVYIYGYAFDVPTVHLVISVQDKVVNEQDVSIVDGGFETSFKLDGIVDTYTVTASYDGKVLATTTFGDCPNQICVKLYPVADSWVDEKNKNDNNGADTKLHVKNQSDQDRMSFLKFDLSSIPSSITSAKLNVYKSGGDSQNRIVYVNLVSDDSWTEDGITWNNMPSYSTLCDSTSVGGANNYYTWTVTSCAQGEYSGDKIISLVMRLNKNGEHKDFYSKEQTDTDKDPYLEVCYYVQCTKDSDCPADYYTCNGNSIIYHDTYCDTGTHTCKESTSIKENCDNYNQNSCSDEYHWVHQTGTCVNGQSTCAVASSTGDCRDQYYCNGQETCSAGSCVSGTPVNCSQYNIPGIATCDNNPDAYHPTWDFREAFTSQCVEDGGNQGHCTTGSETITHTCNVKDCGAECEKNGDCSGECAGNTWNYGGICQNDCTCKYTEQQDCDKLDCTTGIECVGTGTGEIQEWGDDYSCGSNGCEVVGKKPCSEKWICGSIQCPSCFKKKCGETTLICYETGGITSLVWGTQPAPYETNCIDGYDNDCDGYTDCADSDCIGKTGPKGNLCCLSDANCTSFGDPYYYPEIATCDYNPDNYLPTFDYSPKVPGSCDTGINECVPKQQGEISHTCADSDGQDGGPEVPTGNGIRTCSAECDGYGTECQPKIEGDYCYYGGKCNTDPTACTCSYSSSQFCPEPGYTNGTHCWWGTRECTENGCDRLTVTEMGCKNYCNATSGPQDTIGPNITDITFKPNPAGGENCLVNITATAIENCTNITYAEYFFDNKCTGVGKPIYPVDDGSFDNDKQIEYLQAIGVDVSGLSDGGHSLWIRAKNSDGFWGPCVGVPIEIDKYPPVTKNMTIENASWVDSSGYWICANNGNLTGWVCDEPPQSFICDAEYIVDYDITPGDGYPLYPLDGTWGDSVCEQVSDVIINSQYSEGRHWLQIRGHDCACHWGKVLNFPKLWFIIDRSYPSTTKTVSDPKISCGDNCYYVNKSTPITLTCVDPNNGNGYYSNDVTIHWRYQLNNNGTWFEFSHHGSQVTFTYPEDSNHTLEYWCSDACGNEEPHHFEIDIVDTLPPIIEKEFIGPTYYNETERKLYIDGVTIIRINATDQEPHPVGNILCDWSYKVGGGGGGPYTGIKPPFNISFGEESTHDVTITCRDALGNEGILEFTVIVDKTPPNTTKTYGTPYYTNGTSEWINSSTPITLTVEDTGQHKSGIKGTYYRVTLVDDSYCSSQSACESATGEGTWNTYTEPFKISSQSCHLIEYYSVDNVNKTETVKKQCVFVDNTGPKVAKYIGDPKVPCAQGEGCNYYITQNTSITLICSDQQPHPVGGDKIYYRYKVDGGNWSEWILYAEPFHFSEDSLHLIETFCVDKLGNVGIVTSQGDKVDSTPPTTTKTYRTPYYTSGTSEWITSQTPITLTAQDGGAVCAVGVDKIYWRNSIVDDSYCQSDTACQSATGSGDFQEYTGPIYKQQESCHLIEYYSVDKLGNVEPVKKQCFYVENTPPTITKTIIGPQFYNKTEDKLYIDGVTVIQVNSTDPTPHPVNHVTCDWDYTVTDGTKVGQGQVNITPPFNVSFPEESTHILTITCRDALGNEKTDIETFIVDKTPPTTTKTYRTPYYSDGTSEWITSQTPIILTVEDTGQHKSGIKGTYYRVTLVDDSYCLNQTACNSSIGSGIWNTYTTPFTIGEDSCHLIEYYSIDNVDKTEQTKRQCVYVDNTPPVSSKSLGNPKHECTSDEQALYYPENLSRPKPTDGCYFINSSTPITLTCSDQLPHPVDHVKIYYRDYLDGSTPPTFTEVDNDHITIYKTEDSTHILEWYCVDELGNTESTHVEYDIFDNKAPTIEKTIIGPQFYNQTEDKLYIDGVTVIQVNSTDPQPHPVNHVLCNWSYVVQETQQTGGGNNLVPPFNISFPEESTHILTITCRDALGNSNTDVETFIVDKTPPNTTKTYGTPHVTYQGKEWINSSTPITLTVEDTGQHKSGIKGTYYRVTLVGDGNCSSQSACAQAQGSGDWIPYTQPFTINQESCHLIEYYSVDNVNKTETVKKQCVYVDNSAPVSNKTLGDPKHACNSTETLEGISDCWFITQNTQVNLTCSDVGNHPVDQVKIYYKIDWKNKSSDQWTSGTWIEDSNFVSFTYNKDSYHKLTWYCVDALGNKEQTQHVELDIVDTKPPVSSKSFIGTAIPCSQLPCAASGVCDYYITQNTSIKLTCSDQQPHPVDHEKIYYRYFVDGELKQNWTQYTAPIKYNEDSNHTLEWYCVDELGNTEQTHTEIDRVDTTPPVTTKTIGEPKWWDEAKGMYWVTSKTPIVLNVTDQQPSCAAGPSKLYYQVWWDSNCDGTVDTKLVNASVSVNNSTCQLSKTIYLQKECLNEIRWYAEDALGNKENGGQWIKQKHMVDNTPPHLVILKPVDGWYSDGEDIPIVTQAEDLNNPNSSCEKRTGVCDVAGIGISCGNPNDCNGLGTNCSVGIADGAQCYAYLVDVERTIDYIRDRKIPKIMLQNFTLITNGALLYNAQTKQCEGYATIPVESGLRDGVYVLVVGVGDRLGNGANSLTEIGRALNERCGCDVYDMCDPECVVDMLQDIITIWNLPKIGIDNHAPKVTITSPEPNTLFGGEMIYFSANITDSEDGSVTSTITSGTPCYITVGGVSLGTVPYDNENRKCQGIVMIPQDEDFPQGEQELTVKIADNAGNIGEGSISVIVDTVKPILHITDPINNQFVQGVKQIKFTASDAHLNSANVMISTDNGQTWHPASGGPIAYTYDWDTTKETDGMAYGIIAKATDDAGNTGYSEQVIVIVDNGAPEGVYVLDPTKNEIVQGTINLKAIATDYVSGVESVKIKLESDLEGGGSWSCDATWNGGIWYCGFNSTLMPDGLYWVWAEATDKLGHTTYSAMVPFIIDNHPPEKPQLYVNDPEGDGYDTDGTVTWYWNESTDEGSGVDYYVIDITYPESPQHIQTKVFGTTFTYSDLADGTWQAKVKAVDKAGHESEWSDLVNITVDKTKPSPVSISSSGVENPPYDTDGSYVISWSGGSDTNFDRYELYENDTNIYTGSSNSMVFTDKPDGTYEYYVTAYDKAGWTSTSSKLKVTVDTQAPTIQITGTVPGIGFFIATYSVNDAEPSSGIDRIEASSNGYALCSGTIPAGFCTVFLGSNLTLTVYDKAGNFGTASTTGQEKDTTPPVLLMTAPSGVINYNNVVLYAKTNEPAVCYYDTFDNVGTMDTMSTEDDIEHQADLGTLADGLYVYHIRCQDLSGNMMEQSKTVVFAINTESQFSLVIPQKGPNNPGGYWGTGWNTFWLPQLILNDICGIEEGQYKVEDVLSSLYNLNGTTNFDIIWYFDGTEWLYFMPEYPAYSTLQYFNDQSSLPYYIHMTAEDRLEITQDICPPTIPTTTTIPE